jgi:hypothetical protein
MAGRRDQPPNDRGQTARLGVYALLCLFQIWAAMAQMVFNLRSIDLQPSQCVD